MAHLPHGPRADDACGLLQAVNDGFHRAVANRVEARLYARSGARDDVVADLACGEVGESAGVLVCVSGPQACGVRTDRPIREEIACGTQGTQLTGSLHPAELSPVRDDLRTVRLRCDHLQQRAQVVLAGDVWTGELMDRADA